MSSDRLAIVSHIPEIVASEKDQPNLKHTQPSCPETPMIKQIFPTDDENGT